MNDRLERALTEVKAEMNEPQTETSTTTQRAPMKKSTAKKKTTAPKKAAAPKKAKKTPDENSVSLKTIAKELKIEPRDARRALRKAKIEHDGRWSWPKDSAALKKVRDLLAKKE